MNKRLAIISSTLAFITGILLFMIHYEWIIFRFTQPVSSTFHTAHTKKTATLSYWHNNRWHSESQELIWSPAVANNLSALITSWLALLDIEQITPKKILLQGVSIGPNSQDVFISLDRNPFSKEWAIRKKWMLIEGLLKTIRDNNIPIKTVRFLVRHQPILDPHLDLSFAWPIEGFTQSQLQ